MMTKQMRTMVLAAAASLALSTLILPDSAYAQRVTNYGPEGEMVLVTPDGRVLDNPPEYGSVEVYRNMRGERVLVDHAGHLVATEVPAGRLRRERRANASRARPTNPNVVRLPRSGTRGSVRRLDLPPQRAPNSDYSSLQRNPSPLAPAPRQAEPSRPSRPSAPAPGLSETGQEAPKAEIAALQVFLDRAGASPGVIDGRMGGNVQKALDAYATMTGQRLMPSDTAAIRRKLRETGGPAVRRYTITASDAAGPYVASIPSDYARKAQLKRLGFTSTAEMLAERFHMDESYMKALNPGVDFSIPGTTITVADPKAKAKAEVSLIVADKTAEQVRAYTQNGDLVAAYPATIGSTDTPSPSGTVKVERIADDPTYTYNPKINFKQGSNDKVLTVPPGPNGPVGSMWIALSKPTYGIHGTPEPSLIGKSNSHGCVRLTNWDAHELAGMIKPGVTVKFTK